MLVLIGATPEGKKKLISFGAPLTIIASGPPPAGSGIRQSEKGIGDSPAIERLITSQLRLHAATTFCTGAISCARYRPGRGAQLLKSELAAFARPDIRCR
jgi:hypothetical protein